MKNTVKLVLASSILLAFLTQQSGLAFANQTPFSPAPTLALQNYELTRGERVQKFNGLFVKRLTETLSSASAQECLRSLGNADVSITTSGSDEVVLNLNTASCLDRSFSAVSGAVTGSASIPANRILAMVLVINRFSTEAAFATNDRDLSHYDVEIFGTAGGGLKVLLHPSQPSHSLVAGCPHTGPVYPAYLVDPESLTVKLGNAVC